MTPEQEDGPYLGPNRIQSYARAMFDVARAEDDLSAIGDELFRFARALEGSDELREALTDPHIPASRRQQIVEDLLGSSGEGEGAPARQPARPATISLVSMAVGVGRAGELPAIIDALVAMTAEEQGRAVAEVRSVVELDDDQRRRLTDAINTATGKQVEIKVIIDPTILGGIVTTVGDTVIDGSVRARLEQLKHAF